MNKRILISISIIVLIMFVGLLGYFVFFREVNNKEILTTKIDATEIESQIDQIKVFENKIRFLTYRGTALAELDDSGISIITEQIFPQELIDNVEWLDENNALISFINDSNKLSELEGYVQSDNEYQVALFSLEKKTFTMLNPEVPSVFLLGTKVFGIKDRLVYRYNIGWQKTNVSINNPLFSSKGKLIADLNGAEISIYNSGLEKIRSFSIGENANKISVFDDGSVAVLLGEKLTLFKSDNKKREIIISNTENLLFGENIIIYSQNKSNFGYFPLQNKIFKLTGLPKDITYLNIFGLSSFGAIYTEQEDFEIDYWKFK